VCASPRRNRKRKGSVVGELASIALRCGSSRRGVRGACSAQAVGQRIEELHVLLVHARVAIESAVGGLAAADDEDALLTQLAERDAHLDVHSGVVVVEDAELDDGDVRLRIGVHQGNERTMVETALCILLACNAGLGEQLLNTSSDAGGTRSGILHLVGVLGEAVVVIVEGRIRVRCHEGRTGVTRFVVRRDEEKSLRFVFADKTKLLRKTLIPVGDLAILMRVIRLTHDAFRTHDQHRGSMRQEHDRHVRHVRCRNSRSRHHCIENTRSRRRKRSGKQSQ